MSRKAKPKDKRSYIFSGMENKRQESTSSSSLSSLDHLFGPKDPPSSSKSGIFGTIFPPPSVVLRNSSSIGIMGSWNNQGLPHPAIYGNPVSDQTIDGKGQSSGTTNKDKSSSIYHNGTVAPCNLCSSIHYGGQENYSPTNTTDSPNYLKKKEEDDDPNRSNFSGASRGNWWEGSLYY
ncbi:hypothetical protein ES319_A05G317800v1 [Gossypium barbadense]|uniref:Uncharacterized protein n=2 Tax=Gossypium TaxID=3633 RepID=A0A5J5VWQ2_GOSBA|nr:hypothetical protein ES319_A05G317800v1 [Gossypium barbadense]TYH19199.1 hypothetical protein ES288_A05G334100v1 [Gossypium darwinii]